MKTPIFGKARGQQEEVLEEKAYRETGSLRGRRLRRHLFLLAWENVPPMLQTCIQTERVNWGKETRTFCQRSVCRNSRMLSA